MKNVIMQLKNQEIGYLRDTKTRKVMLLYAQARYNKTLYISPLKFKKIWSLAFYIYFKLFFSLIVSLNIIQENYKTLLN